MCEFCAKYTVRYDTFLRQWAIERSGKRVATANSDILANEIAASLNKGVDVT